MIGLLVAETVVQFYQTYMANWVGQNVIKDLREETYHKISAFKLKYFDQLQLELWLQELYQILKPLPMFLKWRSNNCWRYFETHNRDHNHVRYRLATSLIEFRVNFLFTNCYKNV